MRTHHFLTPAVLILAACGVDNTTGPLGPNGGENRVVITVGDAPLDVDGVSLLARSSTSAVELRFSGSVDPIKEAVDDEYGIDLSIVLDRPALEALSAPADLVVAGSSAFSGSATTGQLEVTWTPTAASSSVVQEVLVTRGCFCANEGSGTQTANGKLTFTAIREGSVTGHLELVVTGDVLNYTGSQSIAFDVDFDLALQPQNN
ncbi:MAG: hypothetical protein H6730_22210 [Deltaproteobacteria bacterium]|nr:hypothetical protein [Deltaproteobacteria bacterium]